MKHAVSFKFALIDCSDSLGFFFLLSSLPPVLNCMMVARSHPVHFLHLRQHFQGEDLKLLCRMYTSTSDSSIIFTLRYGQYRHHVEASL